MSHLFGSLTGIIVAFFIGAHEPKALQETAYVCQDPVWTDPPQLVNNDKLFTGTIEATCQFEALSGGGFAELEIYMIEQTEAGAKEIHFGPQETVYEGLPGFQYNLTADFISENQTITARGNTYIVTNNFNRFIQFFLSKELSGTGNGKYVRKMDMGFEVTTTDEEFLHTIQFKSTNHVERPWYVPAGLFLDTAKEEIETQLLEQESEVIEEVANHL